jgi:RNA polymerase-binding transcription factor DksA
MLSQDFIAEMKQALEEQKQKLSEELKSLSPHTELGEGYDEKISEAELDEVNHDLIERIKGDLEKIDKALAKVEQGTYGTDDQGKEIGEARLRALPWADKAI